MTQTPMLLWVLSALMTIITSIGGLTASRLLNQFDTLNTQVSVLSNEVSSFEETRRETNRRLLSIEDKLDYIRTKQTLQAEK